MTPVPGSAAPAELAKQRSSLPTSTPITRPDASRRPEKRQPVEEEIQPGPCARALGRGAFEKAEGKTD